RYKHQLAAQIKLSVAFIVLKILMTPDNSVLNMKACVITSLKRSNNSMTIPGWKRIGWLKNRQRRITSKNSGAGEGNRTLV
ncbi:hypothetical protein UXP97_08480, partial [Enterobacter roggenkampii]|uniref:hypothetical protein n=1 Tax=Enterobacter roggenkampii TaxID=1812935 RepID=UPI002FD72BBF